MALTGCVESAGGGIDLVDVSGPLDASALDFISEMIEQGAENGQELTVVQVNSRAVLDEAAFERLRSLIELPPLPVAIWVGPSPAVAFGGVADLVAMAPHAAIAPGSVLGHFEPAVLGVGRGGSDEMVTAEESGLDLQPTFRQYLQDLHGVTLRTEHGPVVVSTLRGIEGGITTRDVTFRKPGLITRFFRLGVTPEAAFFFLTIGLTIAVFEFYALGPGVAAAVASVALIIGGWGAVTLPTRWWALGLLLLAYLVLVAAHQIGGILVLSLVGAGILQLAGTFLVDGAGQLDPRWWLVLPSVLATLFFFLIAMPTVQRARLSTDTIGRESLIGEAGIALADFDPNGFVEVRGARWMATAHREAGISAGDPIVVDGVDGMYLEVDRPVTGRET